MNDRDRLIELLEQCENKCNKQDCEICKYQPLTYNCYHTMVADHLIANGVTFKKHGEWFLLDECSNEGVYCSVCCKKVYDTHYANQKIKSKFCPNCGAEMDR